MDLQDNRIPHQQENADPKSIDWQNIPFTSLQQQQTENCKQIHDILDDQFYEEKSDLFFPIFLEKVRTGEYDDKNATIAKNKQTKLFGKHYINVKVPKVGETLGVYYDIMTPGKQARNIYIKTKDQAESLMPRIMQYIQKNQIKDAKKLFKNRLKVSDTSERYLDMCKKNKDLETTIQGMKERPN